MKRGGFTLVEALMAMGLFLLVLAAAMEFLASGSRSFRRAETAAELREEAMAALEKAREDLRGAGGGLVEAVRLEALEPVSIPEEGRLVARCSESSFVPAADVAGGSTAVTLADGRKIPAGRKVCFLAERWADFRTVAAASGSVITLDRALENDYSAGAARIALVEEAEWALDGSGVLRRKANRGTFQPVLEGVRSFRAVPDGEAGAVRVILAMISDTEVVHEIRVQPRNAALASGRGLL